MIWVECKKCEEAKNVQQVVIIKEPELTEMELGVYRVRCGANHAIDIAITEHMLLKGKLERPDA